MILYKQAAENKPRIVTFWVLTEFRLSVTINETF